MPWCVFDRLTHAIAQNAMVQLARTRERPTALTRALCIRHEHGVRKYVTAYFCVWAPCEDEQEAVPDLEEVDEDDIDGEQGRVWRDRSRVEIDDIDYNTCQNSVEERQSTD